LQGVAGGCRGLQGVAGGCRGLQLQCVVVAVCEGETRHAVHESQCFTICCSVLQLQCVYESICLQCVAVCCSCSVLRCVAVAVRAGGSCHRDHCSHLLGCVHESHSVAVCCIVLQLQCVKVSHVTQIIASIFWGVSMSHTVLQCAAVCCSCSV